jgi:hypothetical protein
MALRRCLHLLCDPPPLRQLTSLLLVPSSAAGCGHGGTRKRNPSRSDHTGSVTPAAIAGVHGRHTLAEPLPLVGSALRNG